VKLFNTMGTNAALSYRDVPGLCKAASLADVSTQGWSLNPGRYVGVAPGESLSDEDFKTQFEILNKELQALAAQAQELEQIIGSFHSAGQQLLLGRSFVHFSNWENGCVRAVPLYPIPAASGIPLHEAVLQSNPGARLRSGAKRLPSPQRLIWCLCRWPES
jgi:hypothetical protein